MIRPIACHSPLTVRPVALRSSALSLEKAFSMGLKSVSVLSRAQSFSRERVPFEETPDRAVAERMPAFDER